MPTPLLLAAPVYPCVYREHKTQFTRNFQNAGLSLCIQGTSTRLISPLEEARFIPVYTGNICSLYIFFTLLSVYPCVYREHPHPNGRACRISGLSLCIQGTSPAGLTVIERPRFIPVYTGNM